MTAAPPCPGCLGTRECWICLGTGAADTEHGVGTCHACEGTRECRYCAERR